MDCRKMKIVLVLLICYLAFGSALRLSRLLSVITGSSSTTAATTTTPTTTTTTPTSTAATTTTTTPTTTAATTTTTTPTTTTTTPTTTAATNTKATTATTTTTDVAEEADDTVDTNDADVTYEVDADGNFVISTPEECARECTVDGTAKICQYTFTLEQYTTLGIACSLCTPNATNLVVSDCQCVQADGIEKAIISTNRMMPGPSIQVCENDWLVIDLDNHLQAQDVTLHWHGILHKGTQYYDGVPFVTQCPILMGNTFRYQFLANRGTHFWHSHTGLQKLDGLYGSLIVRQPKSLDPNCYLYDQDLHSHVVLLSDWLHDAATERFPGRLVTLTGQHPEAMLINGRGQYEDLDTGNITTTPLEVFTVTAGQRYRFRMINAFASVCAARLTVEGHNLTVIASDGDEVEPVEVNDIISFSGERYDFVINANNTVGTYWIQVRALGECGNHRVQQLAILKYEGGPEEPTSVRPTYDEGLAQGVTMNPLDAICNTERADAVCVNQLKNARTVDERILHNDPDVKFYLPFRISLWDNDVLFTPNTYNKHLVNGGIAVTTVIDEITYKAPPSPLLSQYNDLDPSSFCDGTNITTCGEHCTCTHLLAVPLNALVEIILIDEIRIANMSHPFHLHGHTFNVIGMGRSPNSSMTNITLEHVMELDQQGLLERHLLDDDYPAARDTVAVPNNGYTVIRFIADNPGFWLFHCHFLFHVAIGMELVIQVGTLDDVPAVPDNFPTCGNYLSPIMAP